MFKNGQDVVPPMDVINQSQRNRQRGGELELFRGLQLQQVV